MHSRKTLLVATGLAAILAMVFAPMSLASDSGLKVANFEVQGNTVQVTVVSTTQQAKNGQVVVTAVVNGAAATASAAVSVGSMGTSTVSVSFGAPVTGVIQVGIIQDDSSPM